MLRIEFKRSYWLAFIQAAAHGAAAVIAASVDLPLAAKTALVIAVAISMVQACRLHAFATSRKAIVALELRTGGAAAVNTRDGTWHEARIIGTTYVTPLLTVLNLKLDGHRNARHVVIVPDRVAADDFRHLRVILRWQAATNTAADGSDERRAPFMHAAP